MKKIALIGVGNILFFDEGVGCYAAKYMQENFDFPMPIEVVEGGTLGFKLMDYFQEYDRVVLVDTLSVDDAPGSIYHLPADTLLGLGNYRQTAHEVEVVEMLETCSLLGSMAEVSVVGIVPEDIEKVEFGLSATVTKAFSKLVDEIVIVLKESGVDVVQKEKLITLEQLIENYRNPVHPELV